MNFKRYIKVKWFQIRGIRKRIRLDSSCSIAMSSEFEGCNRIGRNSAFGGYLGYGSYIGTDCHISASIGRYCCVGNQVRVAQGNHPIHEWVSLHPAFFSVAKQANFTYVKQNEYDEYTYADENRRTAIVVGNDVWIGDNVLIIAGVKIGDGSVIAAGTVVTHDVPPYTVIGGVPAKIIKRRFSEDQIDFLLEFKWWQKNRAWIEENYKYFRNIEEFIERYNV